MCTVAKVFRDGSEIQAKFAYGESTQIHDRKKRPGQVVERWLWPFVAVLVGDELCFLEELPHISRGAVMPCLLADTLCPSVWLHSWLLRSLCIWVRGSW